MKKQEFLSAAIAAARQTSVQSNLPAGVTVAQAVLESAWGESRLAHNSNNYFVIKARGDQPVTAIPTSQSKAGETKKLTTRIARYRRHRPGRCRRQPRSHGRRQIPRRPRESHRWCSGMPERLRLGPSKVIKLFVILSEALAPSRRTPRMLQPPCR